jgi:hypothetical protein
MIAILPAPEIARPHDPRRQMGASNRPAMGLKRMIPRLHRAFEIPVGYEDETGFHYGPAPAPTILSFEI